MSLSSIGLVIGVTYGGLVLVWFATIPLARRAFARQPLIIVPPAAAQEQKLGAPLGRSAGVLLVFVANIATMIMTVIGATCPSVGAFLEGLRLELPTLVNIAGAVLFVVCGLWGTLTLFFNPSYSPFFLKPKTSFRLATKGPYALVRHPRYVVEAAVNLVLFLLTGLWVPLLGILGWPALREQAVAEEEYLMRIAPAQYGVYAASTGRFLPRLGHRLNGWKDKPTAPNPPPSRRGLRRG